MSFPPRTRELFVAGGSLRPNAPSYVKRFADDELFELTQASQFSYVLTPRQTGKTSLMHRTAQRLKKEDNVRTARIDLTSIGTASVEGWYLALLAELTRQFRLSIDLKAWWEAHSGFGAVTRFTNFVRDVLLREIDAQVVIFIDEIDFTLSLDFSDDFFAAIRAFYNARPQEPAFERLTFVLLGVAIPSDLINDRTRTPFNIGKGLILPDFSLAEAQVLQHGLEKSSPGQGEAIFRQIYQWTDGHPYLTQKLCQAVVKAKQDRWNNEKIDELVQDSFLSQQGRKEDNLQFVQNRILTHPQQRQLLRLYKKVYNGKKIQDNSQSLLQNHLKLSGLVKVEDGYLQVRNNIYRQVFDLAWIKTHTTIDWTRIIAVFAVLITLFLFGLLAQSTWARIRADRLALDFYKGNSATERVTDLAQLFRLRGFVPPAAYDYRATEVFYGLSQEEQVALFNGYYGPEQDLIEVVKRIYTTLADVNQNDSTRPVLKAMHMALKPVEESEESTQLEYEIIHWLEGRRLFQPGSYNKALAEYNQAIDLNDMNPATLYERARVRVKLGQYEAALADLDGVMAIAQNVPVPANATPTVIATATTPQFTPTSDSTLTFANRSNNEPFSSSPLVKTKGTAVVTPTAQATATKQALPTPGPAIITAQLDTREKIRSAVRALIEQEPSLVQAFTHAPDPQYVNLQTTISSLLARAIAQKDGMVQVYVSEGEFEMGSADNDPDATDDEKPRHTVYLDAFWIDQTEVTNAMFARFVAETKNQTEKEGWGWVWDGSRWNQVDGAEWRHPQGPESDLNGLDDHPVVQVTWNEATTYCQWTNRRLPTEAEWEKAAGGTDGRKYPWGNDAPTGERLNFCDQNCPIGWKNSMKNDGYELTSPVGNYPAGASPYGALDMAGNVWEWVFDEPTPNYYESSPRENPVGLFGNGIKVLRGGSWYDFAPDSRVRVRRWSVADSRDENWGFRCARSP